jgi:hypothetical protein
VALTKKPITVGNAFSENIFDTLSCFPGVDESAE